MSIIEGRALVFGDHVNADQLHPPAFFSLDSARVRSGFLAGMDRDHETLDPSTRWIVVAGRNFGCGSSRETTLQSLRESGVLAIVAVSFGRIFHRTATALGLRCWAARSSLAAVTPHEALHVDPASLTLVRRESGDVIELVAPDPFIVSVAEAGGLLEWLAGRVR